jgi:hypothetical protein
VRRLCLIIVSGSLAAAGARAQALDEYQLKAAFIYNFAKFVQWPSDAFQGPADPITTCVLGQDPFGHELEKAIKGKAIDGRPLALRRISNVRQAAGCRILFVGSSEGKRMNAIVTGLKETGVLTVGETEGTTLNGAIINFTVESGKVRFEVDVDAADRGKLRVSSKLLSLARSVKKQP